MRRRTPLILTLAIALNLLAAPLAAEAQQAGKIPRIGYLSVFSPNPLDDEFRRGLRDLGYVEGRNILVEYRYANHSFARIEQLASEVAALNLDLIVTTTGQSTGVVRKVITTTPLVMASSGDAVRQRSEEHTSELQSQSNLVCRLLLEDKKHTLVS